MCAKLSYSYIHMYICACVYYVHMYLSSSKAFGFKRGDVGANRGARRHWTGLRLSRRFCLGLGGDLLKSAKGGRKLKKASGEDPEINIYICIYIYIWMCVYIFMKDTVYPRFYV